MILDILAINGALENQPVNQITGATAIFDYDGFNLRSFQAHTPGWVLMFVETFMNAFSARIKVVHVVNAPSLFLAVFKIAYPFFPKKIQERIFVHPNDGWKSLHSEIPLEILPEKYGGNMKFDSCINLLEDIEKLEDQFLRIFKYGYIKTKTNRQSFKPLSLQK
ncbi:unnamed protein product [Larinioides sclopetarius]|uniref:CRAL-TRIO domain-containing protein n=1 Tax=Larinioides sclopetarius TaxID=280406 RepID=A0AAV1ZAG1_9ARAC